MNPPAPPRALLAQLESLASGLCQDARLRLVLGDRWAWDPARRRILVDRNDLGRLSLEACAGIVAHEAGHQLISRYLDLSAGRTGRPLDQFTFNAIEDARVEAFLPLRYPGVGPWLHQARLQSPPGGASLVVQFLAAIACSATLSLAELPLAPAVREALDRTAASRERAIRGYLPSPDLDPPPGYQEAPGLQDALSPASRGHRGPRESSLLTLARGVLAETLPILEAARSLLEQDQRNGTPPDWTLLQHALHPARHSPRPVPIPRVALPSPPSPPPSDRAYEEAWTRVAPQAEALAALLERVLPRRQRLGWRSGYTSGLRVDLRRAMQAEADPRLLARVWARKSLPTRRRAAFSLLVDLSGSMRADDRTQATLAAVVLFAETLARLDVPFRIDGFQDELIPLVDFSDPLDARARRILGEIPLEIRGQRPGGHNQPRYNDDGPCLLQAAEHLLARPEEDRILMVLCDGRPEGRHSGIRDLKNAIDTLRSRLTLVGLGLGSRTSHVAWIYPIARANLSSDELSSRVGELLQLHLAPGAA